MNPSALVGRAGAAAVAVAVAVEVDCTSPADHPTSSDNAFDFAKSM